MLGNDAVVEESRRTGSLFDGKRSRVDDNGSRGRGDVVDAAHADGLLSEAIDDPGIRDGGSELHVRLFHLDPSGPSDGAVQ